MKVQRFDFARMASKPVRTQHGFIRVDANLTRVGVLSYAQPDGSVFRELRHPDEVFQKDSLDSLRLCPVTDLHVAMVSSRNVQQFGVGVVGEDVSHDDLFVTGALMIQRQDAIDLVQSGKRKELSPGYTCWVEVGEGEFNGERYDGIQRDIVYNHVAIGPRNWGRSGPDVAMKIDGLTSAAASRLDAVEFGAYLRSRIDCLPLDVEAVAHELGIEPIRLDSLMHGFVIPDRELMERLSYVIDVPVSTLDALIEEGERGGTSPAVRTDSTKEKRSNMKKIKVKLDGVTYELEIAEALAPTFEASFGKLQTEAKEQRERADSAEGKLVVAEKEKGELQEKLDQASDPKAIEEAAKKRGDLIATATAMAPEAKFDGLSDRDVKVTALIERGFPKETFDGKDDGFVDGVFVAAAQSAPAPATREDGRTVVPGRGDATASTERYDDKTVITPENADADKAAERNRRRMRDMWKQNN